MWRKNKPTLISEKKTWDISYHISLQSLEYGLKFKMVFLIYSRSRVFAQKIFIVEYASKPTLVLQQAASLGEKWAPFKLCSFLSIGRRHISLQKVDPGRRSIVFTSSKMGQTTQISQVAYNNNKYIIEPLIVLGPLRWNDLNRKPSVQAFQLLTQCFRWFRMAKYKLN